MYVLASIPPSGNSLFVSLAIDHSLDMMQNLRKGNLESLLNCLQNLLISLTAHEGNGKPLGSETTGTTNTMKVRISVAWKVVVDSEVDALDINTTAENIGGNTDTFVELLEFFVALDTSQGISKVLRKALQTTYRSS
jgi:hypothetical protein